LNDNDRSFIFKIVIITLAVVVMSVVFVLLAGLFTPAVDNKEIFAIIGPSFQTVIGCFVGLLGGLVITKTPAP
jgi:hypothetical protein